MAPSSVSTTTCRRPSSGRAASGGIFLGDLGEMKMSEETQIRQIEENIAGLERRIEAMRIHKSADTTAKILELEHIISDLRDHMEWHRRRAREER